VPNQPIYRILIVEDSRVNRLLLVKLLQPLGFEVREVVDGQEAVAVWQSWQPHLILMDIQMPVMDGYEATQIIKQMPNGQETVIIALTASAFDEQREAILKAGCDDFIRKPFQEEILFAKIAEHLGVRYIYSEDSSHILPQNDLKSC
jgi:CheY-like chemotaxis protein